jgi:hypothetical protein
MVFGRLALQKGLIDSASKTGLVVANSSSDSSETRLPVFSRRE